MKRRGLLRRSGRGLAVVTAGGLAGCIEGGGGRTDGDGGGDGRTEMATGSGTGGGGTSTPIETDTARTTARTVGSRRTECDGTGEDGAVHCPEVRFDFEYDRTTTTLDVGVASGVSLHPGNTGTPSACSAPSIAVTFGNTTECWRVADGDSSALTAGDEITGLDVSPGQTIELVWTAPDGDAVEVLERYTVP